MKKHKFYYRDRINYSLKNFFILILLKSMRNNVLFTKSFRQRCANSLINFNNFFNINKLKKFCILTGRLRFVINQTKFSRMIFRELTSRGILFGVMKNA